MNCRRRRGVGHERIVLQPSADMTVSEHAFNDVATTLSDLVGGVT